ncbi:unnamed protein product [Symbiodinium necroappetens]|uniref:Uncharacterized protein n=1 Tax=Symbiodinium necroappetens TaxID=1628268 RepID=A0A813C6K2_9DINO|nr:unnamed protein product [Symbiodinium necroappetens]
MQCFEWIEYFAGSSRCTSKVRLKGYTGARFDKAYHTPSSDRPHSSNFMDINTCSGFVLAIVTLLKCKPHSFAIWLGIKCSSWTSINRGTSMRSACDPWGDRGKPSVREANRMLERSSCLLLLAVALGGCVVLEQPGGSLLEFYPSFRFVLALAGGCEVVHAMLVHVGARGLQVLGTPHTVALSQAGGIGSVFGSTDAMTEDELSQMGRQAKDSEQEPDGENKQLAADEPSETDEVELLHEAAKARISRMTKTKKKRTDLNVPQFVIDRWNSGTSAKEEMADLLLQVNNDKDKFITELELIVRRIKKFVLHINEGWYSEAEMKSELKWSQSGAYVGRFVLGVFLQ